MTGQTARFAGHTPGPWEAYHEDFYGRSHVRRVGASADERDVAAFCTPEDARLIAAAPRLLGALQALLAQVEQARDGFGIWPYANSDSMAETLAQVRDAIAEMHPEPQVHP